MTIQQCYAALGGDYSDVFSRFRSETLVQKFVLKFLKDETFHDLCAALEEEDTERAFRAAHTLKGVCQNLGFVKLSQSSSEMTEMLRAGQNAAASLSLRQVEADYRQTVSAIRALKAE